MSDRENERPARRGRALASAMCVLAVLAAGPFAILHRLLSDILASFHWSLAYIVGELSPWVLLLAGVAFLVPVAASAGAHPESRLYPRARRAYFVWGIVLYLLGVMLTLEVLNLWSYSR